MKVGSTFHCPTCGGPVEVTLQVADGTTVRDVAAHLATLDFEAAVLHDIREHIGELS